jgi:hypothetical protein
VRCWASLSLREGETARSSRGIGFGLNADGKGAHTLA